MDSDEQRKARQLLKEKESGSKNLDWMYKEDGKPDTEDYLMGKRISTLYDDHPAKSTSGYKIEQFSEQISHQAQLDMQAKMREDPLFAIRKREEDAKRKLLDNPVKMKQLQQLVEQQKKKHKKKKHKKHGDDDDLLKQYMQILKQKKKSEKSPHSHKEKHSKESESHRKKSERRRSTSESHDKIKHRSSESPDKRRHHSNRQNQYSDDEKQHSKKYGLVVKGSKHSSQRKRSRSPINRKTSRSPVRRKSRSPVRRKSRSPVRRKSRSRSPIQRKHMSPSTHRRSRSPTSRTKSNDKTRRPRSKTPPRKLTAEEKQRRLEEMTENAKWRDKQRSQNVKRYIEKDVKDHQNQFASGKSADFISPMMSEHASKSSVEERIRRNKFNLQRTRAALDGNFTKH